MDRRYSTGRQVWRVLYPILVYNLAQVGASVVAIVYMCAKLFPQYSSEIASSGDMTAYSYAVMSQLMSQLLPTLLVAQIVTIPLLVLYYKRDEEERAFYNNSHGIVPRVKERSAIIIVIAAIMGLAACFADNVIISLLTVSSSGTTTGISEQISSSIVDAPAWFGILTVGIIGPITEEFIFRRLGYRRLRDTMGFAPSLFISALLFGLFHGNLTQGVYAFAFGILLGYVYERSGSIIAPILMHACANTLSCVLTYFLSDVEIGMGVVIALVAVSIVVIIAGIILTEAIYRKRMQVRQ